MSFVDIMIDQIGSARRTIEEGRPWVPTWQIATPEGSYHLATEFNSRMPEQRERAMHLVSRFMAWKLATSFVLTAEVWFGPEHKHGGGEAILSVGVSRHERIGLVQRIRKRDPLTLTTPEWLTAEQIDEAYTALLPSRTSEITAQEIEQLTSIFGDGGEMQADLLS
jgi:hypothetical protein